MKQKYSHSVIVRLLAIAISSMGTLFLLPLILKTLGEYNFGIWGMVSSITGYLLLLDFGIALACTRYLSLRSEDKSNWTAIISNALALSFIMTAIMFVASAGIFIAMQSGIIAEQHHLVGTIVIITLLEVAISIPLRMYMSILRAEVRYFDIGCFEIIRVSLRIGSITLALFLGAGLVDIVILASLSNLIFFALPLVNTIKRHKTAFFRIPAINKKVFSDLLNFSKSTAVSQAAEFLKFRTDSVLVAVLVGITTSAHYTIIVFIVVMLTQVLMRFLSYWDTIIINNIGKHNYKKAVNNLFNSLKVGIILSLLSFVNVVIFGKTFISLWVGECYTFLHQSLILLTLILTSIAFQMATTPYFNALGKEKINAWIDSGEVLLKFALIIPMSMAFALDGFIYTNLICAIVFGIGIRMFYLSRYSGLSIKFISNKIITLTSAYFIGAGLLLGIYFILLKIIGFTPLQTQACMLIIQIIITINFLYKHISVKKLAIKTA